MTTLTTAATNNATATSTALRWQTLWEHDRMDTGPPHAKRPSGKASWGTLSCSRPYYGHSLVLQRSCLFGCLTLSRCSICASALYDKRVARWVRECACVCVCVWVSAGWRPTDSESECVKAFNGKQVKALSPRSASLPHTLSLTLRSL